MLEIKPLFLCIDTTKAVPLNQNEIIQINLTSLNDEEIKIQENQIDSSKTNP